MAKMTANRNIRYVSDVEELKRLMKYAPKGDPNSFTYGGSAPGIQLAPTKFVALKARSINFVAADMSGSVFIQRSFFDCRFDNAVIIDTAFRNCRFFKCSLTYMWASGSDFRGSKFIETAISWHINDVGHEDWKPNFTGADISQASVPANFAATAELMKPVLYASDPHHDSRDD